jgi:putative ABC transport system permease protein
MRKPSESRSERLFKLFLMLYPGAFRREYGPAMVETFSSRCALSGPGTLRRTIFLLREFAAVVFGGLGLRVAYLIPLVGRGRGRIGAGGSGVGDLPVGRRSRLDGAVTVLRNLGPDLRHTARSLSRSPGLTVSAVLALGLGIGLATTIFSFLYAAMYRPLPVPEGDRIVHLEEEDLVQGLQGLSVTYHDYQDWRTQQTTFEDLAAFYTGTVNLSGDDRPERYFGAFLTANCWKVLHVRPALGRGFLPGEDLPGAPPVAIIAYSVWQIGFGGDPEVVGRTVRVNGEATTIVGVMPEGFAFPYWEDVWLPLKFDPGTTERGGGPGLEVFGRLRENATLEEARAEFAGISARLAAAYPETNQNLVAVAETYIDSYHGEDAGVGAAFFLGFGLSVLLIACFNVANLLLARAVTQTRDLAVRVAMGASRLRVVVRVLQQALLLASAGAVLGTLLAITGVGFMDRWITTVATYPLPFWMELKVDQPVLLFVLSAVAISALASGLVPALRASRTDVHTTLNDASRGNSSLRVGRLSRFLVLSQITLTATLLILAAHLALQVTEIRRADHGYPDADVLTARVALFDGALPDRASRLEFLRELVRRLEERPGVVGAALGTALPGTTGGIWRAAIQGQEYPGITNIPTVRVAYVSPGFFDAFEAPVLEGRPFSASDDDAAGPVAVVNQPFAERFFPGENALGRQIRLGWPEPDGPWLSVVGVVPDLDMDGAMDPEGNAEGVYLPMAQTDVRFLSIAVRTRGDPMDLAPALREEVMALQEDTPIYFVQTLRDAINTNLLDLVLVGRLLWALALAAFLLASVGLYGVTAFLAGQRTREWGVRIALGARSEEILRLVLRQGVGQLLLGLTLGVLLAAGSMAVMIRGGMEMTPWNLPIAGVVCLVLGVTGLAAVLAPAWRATRVDPVEALRAE